MKNVDVNSNISEKNSFNQIESEAGKKTKKNNKTNNKTKPNKTKKAHPPLVASMFHKFGLERLFSQVVVIVFHLILCLKVFKFLVFFKISGILFQMAGPI